MFPYQRQFSCGEGVVVPFVYDEQIEDKLVFKAHIARQVEGFDVDQKIIVKFTKSYCVEAHRCVTVSMNRRLASMRVTSLSMGG
jgi:hypothetical protein